MSPGGPSDRHTPEGRLPDLQDSRARADAPLPSGKRVLRDAFKRLEQEVPERAVPVLRKLRHPDARWVRIPLGALLVAGGVFSFLPVFGIWMLRRPMGHFAIWATEKWANLREWVRRKWRR